MATTTDRRSLLKVLAAGSAAAVTCAAPAAAARKIEPLPEAMGMLYDTTVCIGCKSCVVACREANHLEPDTGAEGLWQMPQDLNGKTKNVIKLYQEGDRVSYMKAQCMHCVDPACAAALCPRARAWRASSNRPITVAERGLATMSYKAPP
jgi:Fe-S-cluster-containing dehydrogenase component